MAGAKRKRASRATGVGRGNGEGSKAGQFQPGEPSRNPQGRPPKVKRAVNSDLRSLFREMLNEEVPVNQGGVSRMMPQQQAMIRLLMNDFSRASHRDRLDLMKFLVTHILPTPAKSEIPNGDIPPQSIIEFVEGLAQEHARLEAEGLA